VFFLSSRVHPGETPSSFVFNGFIDFILREDDPRAAQLRRQYVFKLVPMLNPDGVVRGHYRTDSRGVNLNRVYLDPSFELHPSVYAVKSILVFHHVNSRIRGGAGDMYPALGVWVPNVSQETSTGSAESTVSIAAKPSSSLDMVPTSTAAEPPVVNTTECTVTSCGECTIQNVSKTSVHCSSVGSGDGVTSHVVVSTSGSPACDAACAPTYLQPGCDVFVAGCNSVASCVEAASGGECEDFDDDACHVGNEGSDDDDEDTTLVTEGVYSPHLSDPVLLTIAPANSGIAFYVDLHAHASKRGCFMYGNYLEDDDAQTDNVLYARLIAINSAHFDFEACNFTERNMYSADRKEGLSKEGSGRVALHKTLGIIHWY